MNRLTKGIVTQLKEKWPLLNCFGGGGRFLCLFKFVCTQRLLATHTTFYTSWWNWEDLIKTFEEFPVFFTNDWNVFVLRHFTYQLDFLSFLFFAWKDLVLFVRAPKTIGMFFVLFFCFRLSLRFGLLISIRFLSFVFWASHGFVRRCQRDTNHQ